jgi:hypothetical protein
MECCANNSGVLAGAYFSLTQTCNPYNLYVLGHVQQLFFVFKELFADCTQFLILHVARLGRLAYSTLFIKILDSSSL